MQVIEDIGAVPQSLRQGVVLLGSFDGVHRGHQAVIGRALGQLGSRGDVLRKQFGELRGAKAPADDRRWLDLYVRACRYRECCGLLDRVSLVDLRRSLEHRFDELLGSQVLPDDPRWGELKSLVSQIGEKLGPARPTDTTTMRASIENLARAPVIQAVIEHRNVQIYDPATPHRGVRARIPTLNPVIGSKCAKGTPYPPFLRQQNGSGSSPAEDWIAHLERVGATLG